MSQESVEIVRRLYDAVARRDTDAVFSLYDQDVEWDGTRSRWAEVFDGPATFQGHAGLRAFFRRYVEVWETFDDELQELIDTGDKVISVVTSRGRGRASGVEIEWPGLSGLWTIRGGKIIHVAWFSTREAALEAAGLRDESNPEQFRLSPASIASAGLRQERLHARSDSSIWIEAQEPPTSAILGARCRRRTWMRCVGPGMPGIAVMSMPGWSRSTRRSSGSPR